MKYEWKSGDEIIHEDGDLGVFHKPMSQNALESCGWRLNAPSKPYSSSHYTSKREGLEAIDVIEAFDLNRNLANVCKYILRCNHKGQRDSDLEKAINYLWRERYGTWLPRFEAICPAANCKKQVYPGGRFCEWHADLVDKKDK